MADETSESVRDRFNDRFEAGDRNGGQDPSATDGDSDPPERDGAHDPPQQTRESFNVKEEWRNHSIYLPDDLAQELQYTYNDISSTLGREFGMDVSKTRGYYPFMLSLAFERLEQLDSEDIKEGIERFERPDE